ncbi:MAG: CUAEP/CCAEP-tail radical SAM (seleno)protein [Nitriliruptorales bacterium]
MRVLLVSTYELGHQPLHVAAPAAALQEGGHEVRCVDTAVEHWDPGAVGWADAVAFSVPMHTAMRLAMRAAAAVKDQDPDLPTAFYGLYAPVSRDLTIGRLADAAFAGTYTPGLVAWVGALEAGGRDEPGLSVSLDRPEQPLPARDLLPPLQRYAHLAIDGTERPVGYVEATQGCLLACRHCPVPTVYGGRFRAVPREAVLADIDQLVAAGATHITFGDPDFLNGPTHSMKLVRELHASWPDLTFDVTTKVDHVVRDADLWEELAAAGCLFVVSAFETTNDAILARLDKGHTAAQEAEVVTLLRRHGIEPRPSWLPFTPWTTLDDLVDLLDFVVAHDLVGNVDPVQYTIRLLLPEGSLLLGEPTLEPHLGPYDAETLSYRWTAADPRVDGLQRELTELVEQRTEEDASAIATFLDVNAAVRRAAGRTAEIPDDAIPAGATEGRPRLTEPWFC